MRAGTADGKFAGASLVYSLGCVDSHWRSLSNRGAMVAVAVEIATSHMRFMGTSC
jgi:hypothetical protein